MSELGDRPFGEESPGFAGQSAPGEPEDPFMGDGKCHRKENPQRMLRRAETVV